RFWVLQHYTCNHTLTTGRSGFVRRSHASVAGRSRAPLRKLRWCEIAERRVRPHLVVVAPPGLDLLPRVGQIEEPVLVQTLVAELAVEALDEAVLHGPTRGRRSRPGGATTTK